jgi:hypothetical protein
MRLRSVRRVAAALAAALCLLAPAAVAAPPRFDGPTISNPRTPPDFALFDQQGQRDGSVRTFIRRHRLRSQFRYLTGTRRVLAPIWQAYGVESTAQGGDHVDHTLYTLLIDRAGRGRVLYDSTATSSEVAHDVRLLLARP